MKGASIAALLWLFPAAAIAAEGVLVSETRLWATPEAYERKAPDDALRCVAPADSRISAERHPRSYVWIATVHSGPALGCVGVLGPRDFMTHDEARRQAAGVGEVKTSELYQRSLGQANTSVPEQRVRLTAEERDLVAQLNREETARADRLKARATPAQRIKIQKFALKVDRILSSMDSYSRSSWRNSGSVLRKDIDRYDDALVEAKGEVPDGVIAYAEDAYAAFRASMTTTDFKLIAVHVAKRSGLRLLAE